MNKQINERMNEWLEWINDWTLENEWTNELNKQINWINKRMNEWNSKKD